MDVEKTIVNLRQHNFDVFYIEEEKNLFVLLDQLLENAKTVGCGDSITLETLGVYEYLRKGDFIFYDKYKEGLSSSDKREIYLNNFRVDAFFSSVNAITEDGKIFNIDGNGSRVAPIIYGPEHVILICGTNKIVKDEKQAYERARTIAAPLDAKRLKKSTPCTISGECSDCMSKERICNDFVLINGQFIQGRIKVIILDKELGY